MPVFCKGSEIDTFISASFNGIRNCSHMEKINNFTFGVFLFLGDEVKTNDWKYFDISVSAKNSTLGTVIYLLERIYEKEIKKD